MELGEICRTCLRRGQPVSPLFDENKEIFTSGKPLVEFVNMFTEITIFRTEGFPEQICTTCLNDIKRAYIFKLRCECSETTLYHLKETNSILNLENFDFDVEFTKLNDQLNNDQMKDDSLMDTSSEDVPEITNSIMQLLEVETAIEEALDPNLQAELDAVIEQQMFLKNVLESSSSKIKDVATGELQDDDNGQFLICSACPETFPSRDLLKTHVIDFHTDGKLCILCNEEFECMKIHSEKHLLPRLQCSHCDQKFEYRPLLTSHLRTHMIPNEETGKLEFKCDRCPKSFTSHHEFMTHKRAHTEDRPFSCETCGMAFKRRDKLKAHMTSHSNERPFECTLCESRFKRKDNLTSHLKSVHQQGDKVFKCNICEKAFRFKDKLKAHMNTHLRLFSCELCHAGFQRKESLDRHIDQKHKVDGTILLKNTESTPQIPVVDLEMKSFPCSICNKEFSSQDALSNHMKTHVKKVELKCDLCLKVFSQSNKLKSHMITHTDLRPFQCTFCPSLFKRKDNLNRHMKKHTRTKGGSAIQLKSESQTNCENNVENDINCDNESTDRIDESQLNENSRVDSIEMEETASAIAADLNAIDTCVQNNLKSLEKSLTATETDTINLNQPTIDMGSLQKQLLTKELKVKAEKLKIHDKKSVRISSTNCADDKFESIESAEPIMSAKVPSDFSNFQAQILNIPHRPLMGPFNEAQSLANAENAKNKNCTNHATLSDSYTIANLLRKSEIPAGLVDNLNINSNSIHSNNCLPVNSSQELANHLNTCITISNHADNSDSHVPNNHLNHAPDVMIKNSLDTQSCSLSGSAGRCLRSTESV